MLEGGYIKLPRSFLHWEWYTDGNVWRLLLHLLLTVNYEDSKWRGIEVKRGSRVTSIAKLSEETGLSVRQTRTALDKLIATNEVTKCSTAKYTVISVNNYDEYQNSDNQKGEVMTKYRQAERQSNDKLMTTKEESKRKQESKKARNNVSKTDVIDRACAREDEPVGNGDGFGGAKDLSQLIQSGATVEDIAAMIRAGGLEE